MAGELNFKAVFDYGDAQKSVDELFDIFEQGALKMNEAFSIGRTVDANKKQLRDMLSVTRQTLVEMEAVYKSSMEEIKKAGGFELLSEGEKERLNNLKDGMDAARAMIRGLEENLKELNYNKNIFAGLTQGLQGLMGAYTAASGILAQFNVESEDLVKIQTKLQASMSILMGIQQVYNTLESTSAFRTQIVTKATELYAKAQVELAKSSTLAKLGIAGLVAVMALAAIKIVQSTSKIAKANKEAAEQYKAISEQASKSAASQIATFHKLQTEWQNTNGDINEQKKLVEKNKDEWKKLGLEVNNINDYEKYSVEQAPAIINAMTKKAQAAANLAVAEGLYAQAIQARMDSENGKKTRMNLGQLVLAGAAAANNYNGSGIYDAMRQNFEEENKQKLIDKATELEGKAQKLVDESIKLSQEAEEILPGNKTNNVAGNIAMSAAKYAELLAKQQKEIARQVTDFEFETEQARINAMEEGTERTLKQIDLNFRKEEEAIQRWYDDLIDEKIARDRELWNAEHPGEEFIADRSKYSHTAEEEALFGARNAENTATRLSGRQSVFDRYLTFTQQFGKLSTSASKDVQALKEAGASMDAIDVATKKAGDSFAALAKQWAESGWDEGLVEMKILLTDLEGELEAVDGTIDPERIELLRGQINALKDAMKGSATQTEESKEKWTDFVQVLNDAAELFDQIGSSIGGPMGEAISMLGKFASSLAKIRVGIDALDKTKSFAENFTAGVTIASAAISAISAVVGKIREARERTEEVARATEAYERVLERIADSRALDMFSNAFGADRYGAFVKNMEIATEAFDKISKLSSSFNNQSGIAGWLSSRNSGTLVSDMRNDWQQFWGTGNDNIIKKQLSDFFDESGNLLGKDLQEWYEKYGEGLTASNKKMIEDILNEWERWEDAVKEISGYLGDLFSNVAGSLADKMVENFIATGNAIADMTDYLDDFSRKLAKSIIQGQLLDQVFDKAAQDEIGTLIAQGDIAGAVEKYNALLGRANELAPGFNEWLQQIDLKDAVKGQNATTGGFQTMSQDVANELNGRFAALQIAGENILVEARGIHEDTSGMASSMEALQGLALISMGHLEDISKFTSVLPDMSERVINIEKYSKQMVS